MIDTSSADHYVWGAGSDGWHLVRDVGLSVIEERMPPHTSETRHVHSNARQFFYILAGVATFERDGTTHTLLARQGIEVAPGAPHQIRNDADEPLEFLVVSSPPSHGDRYSVPSHNLA